MAIREVPAILAIRSHGARQGASGFVCFVGAVEATGVDRGQFAVRRKLNASPELPAGTLCESAQAMPGRAVDVVHHQIH